MNNIKEKKKEVEITFRILEIKKISHSEYDYSEYGLTEEDLKRAQGQVVVKFAIINDEECLAFTVESSYECKKDKENYTLFSLEVLYKFQIKDFNNIFKSTQPEEVKIPDQFLQTLMGIAISGARGIQAVVNTNQRYKNVFIPIVNTKEMLRPIKLNKQGKGEEKV